MSLTPVLRWAVRTARRTGLKPKQMMLPYAWLPLHLHRDGRAWNPLSVTLDLTYLCNLRCRMCSLVEGKMVTKGGQRENPELLESDGRLRPEMTTDDYLKLIRQMGRARVRRVLFTGGEPTLRPDILTLARAVKREGMTLGMISNATGRVHIYVELMRAGLDTLTVSFDGVGEVHDQIRGVPGSFRRSREILEGLLEARRAAGSGKPRITVSCAISSLNAQHVDDVVRYFQDVGVDHLNFGYLHFGTSARQKATEAKVTGPVMHLKASELPAELKAVDARSLAATVTRIKAASPSHRTPVSFTPDLSPDQIRRQYEGEDFTFANKCFVPWLSTRIDPWGQMYPCWIDVRFGDVRERPFLELWNSGMYRAFRKTIREGLLPKCATCCALTERSWSSVPILR